MGLTPHPAQHGEGLGAGMEREVDEPPDLVKGILAMAASSFAEGELGGDGDSNSRLPPLQFPRQFPLPRQLRGLGGPEHDVFVHDATQ